MQYLTQLWWLTPWKVKSIMMSHPTKVTNCFHILTEMLTTRTRNRYKFKKPPPSGRGLIPDLVMMTHYHAIPGPVMMTQKDAIAMWVINQSSWVIDQQNCYNSGTEKFAETENPTNMYSVKQHRHVIYHWKALGKSYIFLHQIFLPHLQNAKFCCSQIKLFYTMINLLLIAMQTTMYEEITFIWTCFFSLVIKKL